MPRFANRPDAIEEPHRQWDDVLDEGNIPVGVYDLNYRLPWRDRKSDHWRSVGFLCALSLVGLVTTPLLQLVTGSWIASPVCMAGVYGLALLAASIQAMTLLPQRLHLQELLVRILPALMVPIFIWASLSTVRISASQAGAMIYLAVFALPAALFIADQLSTHALFWSTAAAWNELATILCARETWKARLRLCGHVDDEETERLVGPRFVSIVRWYPVRFPVLLATVMTPVVIWHFVTGGASEYLRHTIAVSALGSGLVTWLAVEHSGQVPRFRPWLANLSHWLWYEVERESPPWVFRPPIASSRLRQLLVGVAYLLFAPAILGLTQWCDFFPAEAPWQALSQWQPGAPAPFREMLLAAAQVIGCAVFPMFLFLGAIFAASARPIGLFHALFD